MYDYWQVVERGGQEAKENGQAKANLLVGKAWKGDGT